MVTPLRRTGTTMTFFDGWSSHHATLHQRWLTERCWTSCVQCGICPPSWPSFLPRNFNLSMFFCFCFLKAFLKIRMQRGLMKMIFPPLFSLFFPYMVSTPSFQNSKSTHLVSVFCLHTPLPCWNSGMTTKTKIVQVRPWGHVGPALCGRCLSSVPKMYVSPFTILFCFCPFLFDH